MSWKQRSIVVGWMLLILLGVWLDVRLVTTPLSTKLGWSSVGADFGMYYTAARALRLNAHADIYQLATLRAAYAGGCGGPPTTTYPYQPFLALLLEPLTLLPCTSALFVWWQFSFALWAIVTFWLARDATRLYGPGRGLFVGVLCVTYRPIWNGLEYGQAHILILFVFVLASRLVAKRPQAAGGILATGIFLKYFPAFLAAYHVVRGRWRVVAGVALVGIALLIGELLLVGPGTLVASIGGATSDVATYSQVDGSVLRLIPYAELFRRMVAIVTLGVVLFVTWRRRKGDEALGEAWALCAMLLATPLAWYHYLTWLLPALVVLLNAALDCTRDIAPGWSAAAVIRRIPLVGFAMAYGLILVPGNGVLTDPSLLVLWGLCGALYLASAGIFKRATPIPEPRDTAAVSVPVR